MTLRTDQELDEAWSSIKNDLEQELNRAVNMIDAQKGVIGKTRFKKYLYSILTRLRRELEGAGIDGSELKNIENSVLYAYYGLNNSLVKGIHKEDFERLGLKEPSFIRLAQFNVVKQGFVEYFKGPGLGYAQEHEYWQLMEEYADAGKELAEDKIKEKGHDLESRLSEFPDKIIALFAFIMEMHLRHPYHSQQYMCPYPKEDHYFFSGRPFGSILQNKKVLSNLNNVAKTLMELDLGVQLSHYYRVRSPYEHVEKNEYFVTCAEVVTELKEILKKKTMKVEPGDILANELRRYNVYKFLDEWMSVSLRQATSSDDFERLLKEHNISFEDLKEELGEYEEKGVVVFKTLEDKYPLIFKGDSEEEDLRESFGKIMESLEDSILASFTSR